MPLRRDSPAPADELAVLQDELDKTRMALAALKQSGPVTFQTDDPTMLSDPIPFEVIINRNGTHTPATADDPFVYFHPGEEDESGPIVTPGFKGISTGASICDFAFGGAYVYEAEPIPPGQNVVKPPFGVWWRTSHTNPLVFESSADPSTDGVFLTVKKHGLYMIVFSLTGLGGSTFADMFKMGITWEGDGTDNDFFTRQPESPAGMFDPALWTNLIRPTDIQVIGFDVIPDDGPVSVPYKLYLNNYSGATKTITSTSAQFYFSITRLGGIPEVTTVVPA